MLKDQSFYILDANAIRMLNYNKIQELINKGIEIFTIEEVFHEVQSLKKVNDLKVRHLDANSYKIMSYIINKYECVQRLVNYYDNKGAADVALLAYALTSDDGRLFGDEYIIVTNDNGLQKACEELKVDYVSVENFQYLQ